MGAPQILKTDGEGDLVVLTRRDYDALLARAGDEAAEDRMTVRLSGAIDAAVARGDDAYIPETVWLAIEAGESAIRVVRRWRGLTQAQLSDRIGSPQGYISTLEKGGRTGSVAKLAEIAKALNVPVSLFVD